MHLYITNIISVKRRNSIRTILFLDLKKLLLPMIRKNVEIITMRYFCLRVNIILSRKMKGQHMFFRCDYHHVQTIL